MVLQVFVNLVKATVCVIDRSVHGFATDFGGADVAQIDQFFFVANVVVQSRIGQAKNAGNVFQGRSAVALLVEAVGRGPEHTVALQLKLGFVRVSGHSFVNPALVIRVNLNYFNLD